MKNKEFFNSSLWQGFLFPHKAILNVGKDIVKGPIETVKDIFSTIFNIIMIVAGIALLCIIAYFIWKSGILNKIVDRIGRV